MFTLVDLDPSSLVAIVVAVCSKTVPFASELAVVAVLGSCGLSGAWLVRVAFCMSPASEFSFGADDESFNDRIWWQMD